MEVKIEYKKDDFTDKKMKKEQESDIYFIAQLVHKTGGEVIKDGQLKFDDLSLDSVEVLKGMIARKFKRNRRSKLNDESES